MNRLYTHLLVGLSLTMAVGCGSGFQSSNGLSESRDYMSSSRLTYMSLTSVSGWSYDPLAMSKFNISFDAVPSENNADIVIGLSQNVPNAYKDLATLIRFNSAGFIDVRNGANYGAAASVSYSEGASYRFVMSVDISKRSYSVSVTAPGKSAVVLAQNFSFRSDQASAISLNNFATYGDPGSASVSNILISFTLPDIGSPAPAPIPTPTPAPVPTPPPAAVGDGSNAAPNCAIQRPTLLANYVKRPAWKVAGVDYCVGYPASISLKNPASISMSGVSINNGSVVITGNNITLDGYDFGTYWINVMGSNARIINSRFAGGVILGNTSAQNLYVGYNVIDGLNRSNGLVEMRGKGVVTVEYNWLKNSGGDILQMHTNGASTLISRYNLIENAGMASGAHGDYTEFIGGPFTTNIVYNTTIQLGGTTQGFMVEPDFGSSAGVITTGEIGNNTMVTKGGLSYFVAVTVADVTTSFNVHDNFYDASAGYGFAIGGGRGGPGDSSNKTSFTNNVNMVNGAVQVGP